MIVDSSAILAVMFREPGFEPLLEKLTGAAFIGIGCPTLVETGIVLSARMGFNADPLLLRFIQEFGIEEVPFGSDHWRVAVEVFRQFGRGNHPAKLNFGDCMSYAVSKLTGHPLLFAGEDFAMTDIPKA